MSTRPKLAVVTTVYRPNAHSDVIVSRWLEPRPADPDFGWPVGGAIAPRTSIASLYIAQFPDVDTGREIAAKHEVPIYSTVREALTLGGDTLAVDGVLIIGEHGDYPYNELHQHMYPRRELFDEVVAVFRESGRSVPVFNDKHLSYDKDSALHMVNTAREMGFPLMAGSSIPTAGCLQPWTMPEGTVLKEGMGLFYGGLEAYGYHAIEYLQSLLAARAGGETGIESVTVYYGDNFWQAEADGVWPAELVDAAMQHAAGRQPGHHRDNLKSPGEGAAFAEHWPSAFCFHHSDGLRSTYLMLSGHISDFAVAVEEADGTIHSAGSKSSLNGADNFYAHFAELNAAIEEFMLTGKSPYPIEHNLLCTLAINAAVHALRTPGEVVPTPQLMIPYKLDAVEV